MSDTERTVGEVLDRPTIKLAIIIVVILMLAFIAIKDGFSLWVMSKLGQERMTVCPPGKSPNVLGVCR
jgi:hypothetical protein